MLKGLMEQLARGIRERNSAAYQLGVRDGSAGDGFFEIEHRRDGKILLPWSPSHNLMPTEGRNFMLNVTLNPGVAKINNWFIMGFATNTAPTDDTNAANIVGTLTEFKNYDESTRQAWVMNTGGAASSVISNSVAPAQITIGDGTTFNQFSLFGLALISVAAKASTTGTVLAATLLPAARTGLQAGDFLGLRYSNGLTSS